MVSMSPKKHLEDSKRHREQKARRGHIRMEVDKRKPGVIIAATSAEWEAKGGKVERIPCTWTAPTRFPRPEFARPRNSGGVG